MSEQKENLRKAESSLQDAEKRLAMVRKWQPIFKHAVLEYHASIQRLKDLAAGDVPRAVNLLSRMIDSIEAYLRVVAPSGLGPQAVAAAAAGAPMAMAMAPFDSIATALLDEDTAAIQAQSPSPAESTKSDDPVPDEAPAPVPAAVKPLETLPAGERVAGFEPPSD
jgi:hypothetical protein